MCLLQASPGPGRRAAAQGLLLWAPPLGGEGPAGPLTCHCSQAEAAERPRPEHSLWVGCAWGGRINRGWSSTGHTTRVSWTARPARGTAQVGRRLRVLHLQHPDVFVEMLIQIPRGSFLRCLMSHHLTGVGVLG